MIRKSPFTIPEGRRLPDDINLMMLYTFPGRLPGTAANRADLLPKQPSAWHPLLMLAPSSSHKNKGQGSGCQVDDGQRPVDPRFFAIVVDKWGRRS
jgi:hypothetical protein